jgi:phosphoglycerate dehydrogenase-like enzyme
MKGDMSEVLVLHVADSALEPIYSQILSAFAEQGIDSDFFDSSAALAPQFAGKKVVVDIGGWGRKEHIDAATAAGVHLWHVVGYGLDHLALDEVMASGIPLSRTPGTTTAIPLAEHAMYLLLSVAKKANLAQAAMQEQHFFDGDAMELAGRTMAIIGLGTSGRELARRARAFGMRVLAVDVVEVSPTELASIGVDRCGRIEDLLDVLAESDVVSLHLPLTSQTRHVLDGPALSALRPGAVVLNVARGPLIDEQALIDALRSGHLGGAGLDVFEVEPLPLNSPLLEMPNVVLTPHWAAATLETMTRRARLAAENVQLVLSGQAARYRVLPEHL